MFAFGRSAAGRAVSAHTRHMFTAADTYLSATSAMHAVARQLLLPMLQQLPASGSRQRLLDVGCGTGDVLTQTLLPQMQQCQSVLGVDLSRNMVEFCRRTYASDKFQFQVADFGSPTAAAEIGGTFHRILSSLTLHWVVDHRQALKNIHDLLTPDGYAVLVFNIADSNFPVLERMSQKAQWSAIVKDLPNIFAPYYYSPEPSRMFREAAVKQNLDVQHLSERAFRHRYASVADFAVLLESINPLVDLVPDDQKSDFMQQCTEEALALTTNQVHEDGAVTMKLTTINAVLKRADGTDDRQ